jgi:hypothetical protein
VGASLLGQNQRDQGKAIADYVQIFTGWLVRNITFLIERDPRYFPYSDIDMGFRSTIGAFEGI